MQVMGGHLGLRHCRRLFQPWSARFAGSLSLFPFGLPAQKLRAALLSIDQCPQVRTPGLRRCHLLSGLCVPVLRLLRSLLWGSRNLHTAGSLQIVSPCSTGSRIWRHVQCPKQDRMAPMIVHVSSLDSVCCKSETPILNKGKDVTCLCTKCHRQSRCDCVLSVTMHKTHCLLYADVPGA